MARHIMPCREAARLIPIVAYTYYNCGGAYYQPQYEGDTVVYVTVPDPATVTVQQ